MKRIKENDTYEVPSIELLTVESETVFAQSAETETWDEEAGSW